MDTEPRNTDNIDFDGNTDDIAEVREYSKKAARAFKTITEVSEDLDIPAHVLRFWESKFEEVSPVKRGGGRRYYRPEDVLLLKKIAYLLYKEGYTIKGVQKLLKEGGMHTVATQFDTERTVVDETPAENRRKKLDKMIEDLEEMGDLLKRLLP